MSKINDLITAFEAGKKLLRKNEDLRAEVLSNEAQFTVIMKTIEDIIDIDAYDLQKSWDLLQKTVEALKEAK